MGKCGVATAFITFLGDVGSLFNVNGLLVFLRG